MSLAGEFTDLVLAMALLWLWDSTAAFCGLALDVCVGTGLFVRLGALSFVLGLLGAAWARKVGGQIQTRAD